MQTSERMVCFSTETLLAIASDRSPDRLQRFDDHLDACSECRQLVADLVELSWMRGTCKPAHDPTEPAVPRERMSSGRLVDRYIVIDLLGTGGMGAVYAAYDPRLDRKIALKLLRPTDHADELGARLLREAKMLAKLGHPNVVAVYDAGLVGGNVFVAMELVDGATLRHWLKEQPRTWREIVGVFLQAAAGLAAAHQLGVVHRDFKPDNVLVGRDGRARVADFGLARSAVLPPEVTGEMPPSSDQVTALAGTPAYMAPEQWRGVVSALADQYSFCLALREALHDTRAPARIGAVVERGLSTTPERRHPSMEALARALRPRPRAKLAAVGAAVAASIAVYAVSLSRAPAAVLPTCGNAAAELAGIWDVPVRDELRAQFATSDYQMVADKLDAFSSSWIAERNATCEATYVHGVQSPELLDQRMACLDLRRSDLATRIAALRGAWRVKAADVAGILAGLADPKVCTSRAALAHESTLAASGEVSEFDDGTTASRFGIGWSVSTDSIMGGHSTAKLAVVDGGYAGSPKALSLSGTVDQASSPIAWAGAMFYPGRAPMAPADLSAYRTIVFAARGGKSTCSVSVFSQSKGQLPASRFFELGETWQEYRFPLVELDGVNPADITGLLISSTRPGKFSLQIDHVRFE